MAGSAPPYVAEGGVMPHPAPPRHAMILAAATGKKAGRTC